MCYGGKEKEMPYIKKKEPPFTEVRRLIRGYTDGTGTAELQRALGCCETTARKKLREPDKLTLGDLKRISQNLHIPVERIREAVSW